MSTPAPITANLSPSTEDNVTAPRFIQFTDSNKGQIKDHFKAAAQ